MKTLKLLSAFLLVIVCGCSDSDDHDNTTHHPLSGAWRLTHVIGGIGGTNSNFEPGTIMWNFNTNSNTVAVVNTNTDETLQDFFTSGTYDYSFEENTATPEDCEEELVINNISFGCYSASSTTLILTQIEADGYVVTLKR
ncbi:MAG TPA: hypothetical protein VGB50_11435 [Flavobacterium sp.]|jgi:hypothetical protein